MTVAQILITIGFCSVSFLTGIRLIMKGNDGDKLLGFLNAIYVSVWIAVTMIIICYKLNN